MQSIGQQSLDSQKSREQGEAAMAKANANANDGPVVALDLYQQDLSGCFALKPSNGAGGYSVAAQERWLLKLAQPLEQLQTMQRDGSLELFSILAQIADIEDAEAAYAKLAEGARTIVFFGTGGSSLGGQTLAQLAGWNIPGASTPGQKGRPRTRFYDSLDADTLKQSLASLDLKTTRFVVISKSGGTSETLVQALCALQAVRDAGLEADCASLFLALSEPARDGQRNGLRELCDHFAIPVLDHPVGIGGRFSALTNVGLLPGIARGLDARALRAGARSVVDALQAVRDPAEFAPAQGAALAVGLAKEAGIGTQIVMPYADRLARFSHWFVQLWAESLGKNGEGTTPVAALGPRDQHSQLQLFMDGPRDHLISLISIVEEAEPALRIDADLARLAGIDFLAGCKVSQLVSAQVAAVSCALGRAGRPVRNIVIPKLDERAMGALMMHFMLETILAGLLLGLDPFDQPAVELAKQLAKERLSSGSV